MNTIPLSLDVVILRGPLVESRHRVHAAVVDSSGTLLRSARDPQLVSWWRSCAKPFQALPLVEEGGLEQFGWSTDELALACASHGGEPEHVALAGAMLAGLGLEEGDLACGPHEPLSARGSRVLRESGHRVTRLHNNCSGKHAAMLARAILRNWPIEGYQNLEHPLQQSIHETVARWTGMDKSRVATAVDGCGVTVFGLPLYNMALAYAKLANAVQKGESAPRDVVNAMTGNPFLVGGSERFDSLVMKACGGRVLCKVGAEGVHTLAILDQSIGIAVKVEDGHQRAQYLAVLAVLSALGEHVDWSSNGLSEYSARTIRNTRNESVGEMRIGDESVGAAVTESTRS